MKHAIRNKPIIVISTTLLVIATNVIAAEYRIFTGTQNCIKEEGNCTPGAQAGLPVCTPVGCKKEAGWTDTCTDSSSPGTPCDATCHVVYTYPNAHCGDPVFTYNTAGNPTGFKCLGCTFG